MLSEESFEVWKQTIKTYQRKWKKQLKEARDNYNSHTTYNHLADLRTMKKEKIFKP
jgi:hypothetical protein